MTFDIPSYLVEETIDNIHREMLKELPEDIDVSAGGYVWDLTRPTAFTNARMAQMTLPMVMMQIWPQFATGTSLDYHAESRKLARRQAQYAHGILNILGNAGTEIPKGSIFSTVERNSPAIKFVTTEASVVLSDGTVKVPIQAVEAGITGNVPANTIILTVSSGIAGIQNVTNEGITSGGYDEESDDELRSRIMEYDVTTGRSFIGNAADYRRWALSVPSVGDVSVISAQDDSGLVTIVVVDVNGSPASNQLCRNIYNYIMEGDNEYGRRLAPLNAHLAVIPSSTLDVKISVIVELTGSNTLAEVKSSFMSGLLSYYLEAMSDKEIKYTRISSILSSVEGVNDFKELRLNGGIENIIMDVQQVANLDESLITMTEGTV